MIFVHRLWEFLLASLRRLSARKGTTLAALTGLTLAISLVLSITLYSDGVYYQTFLENVAKTRENPDNQLSKDNPTFSFLFHYFGGWHGSKTWEEIAILDEYFTQRGINSLGIPAINLVRLFGSDVFYLFPEDKSSSINQLSLSRTSFGTMSDLEEHVSIVEGRFPNPQPHEDNSPIEVLINQTLAKNAGLQIGQRYIAHISVLNSGIKETSQIPVQIVGIWRANDPGEDYWIFPANTYENILFVPGETFFQRLTAHIPALIYNAYWYLIMDANYVHADEVDGLLYRISRLERGANQIQENLWLSISPKTALEEYAHEAQVLRVLLYAFSIPVIGLIMAFVGLVTRLSTQQRRGEIAILRSRGGTTIQMLSLTALEGLIIGIASLVLSLPIALQITQAIGRTRGFLDFSNPANIRVGISTGIWQIGFFCVGIYLMMLLLPTSQIAKGTLIKYKIDQGRNSSKPLWQRFWIDVILLIPAAYGTYLLQQQGFLSIVGTKTSNNLFQNPLLFLVPSLGILTLALFSLRLVGPIMAVFEKVSGFTSRVGLLMAARNISRDAVKYHTPLLILTLTMSLFVYTASLSATLDQAASDQAYYHVGADARFFDPGASSTSDGTTWWDFFPVSEYTQSPNILQAARLGRYAAQISVGRIEAEAIFLGLDRIDFPKVAFWREDFSSESLGELMNALSTNPANILIDRVFLRENGLQIGETIFVTIKTYNRSNEFMLKIVGTFDLFPSWYPKQGPLIVGNLDHLFEMLGGPVPYYVLVQTSTGANLSQLKPSDLRALDGRVRPVDWEQSAKYIQETQSAPERQGLFGFLLLGFATAVLLTVLAFLLHLIFSFQQRSVEFGVLRAAGLSTTQMIANLVWEFTFLILLGSSLGTVFGWLASQVYIPYMQVHSDTGELSLPFQVLIPWDTITPIYWLFGILFGISLIALGVLLRRMKIFEAIKLGETV